MVLTEAQMVVLERKRDDDPACGAMEEPVISSHD
jgi:hypothetical protein